MIDLYYLYEEIYIIMTASAKTEFGAAWYCITSLYAK